MMTTTKQAPSTQVYRVYIKAAPQKIWDAITDPEWNSRYGYGGRGIYELKPKGRFVTYTSEEMKQGAKAQGYEVPDIAVDGEVLESDPPKKLVVTWRMLMDPGMAAEGFTRLTYEITELPKEGEGPAVSRLTVVHELESAPSLAHMVAGGMEDVGAGGGWNWILSDLKSLLETGKIMAAA